MTDNNANKLLSGVRVVELGMWVAGPAAAGILADWGAEVIKIEEPGGDPMRRFFSVLSGSREERCPPFDLYNRGKKSLMLDINQPDGRDLVERLIANADVFVTNMRPKFLERVRLDPETLVEKYPRLVYASLTAYGLTGPDRDAPGYDHSAFQGRTGVTDRSTPPGEVPTQLPGGMGDNVTAIATVAGILGALHSRTATGRGQLVGTSLLRTGIYSIGMDVSTRLSLGRIASTPTRSKPRNPLFNTYQAGDGKWFWLVGTESERHWPKVLRALELESLGDDPLFATPRDRRRNAASLLRRFESTLSSRTREEWAEIFRRHDVWWAPINSMDDLVSDPQAIAAGAFISIPGQEAVPHEEFNSVASPVDFSNTPASTFIAPPAAGAHTGELLAELGLDEAAITTLYRRGIVGGARQALPVAVSHTDSSKRDSLMDRRESNAG